MDNRRLCLKLATDYIGKNIGFFKDENKQYTIESFIKFFGDKDRLEKSILLLNRIIRYSRNTGSNLYFESYWNKVRINESLEDEERSEYLTANLKNLLQEFEARTKVILLSGGEEAVLAELESREAGLGTHLSKFGFLPENKKDKGIRDLFLTILKFRNNYAHFKIDDSDKKFGTYNIPLKPAKEEYEYEDDYYGALYDINSRLESFIHLCSCGLLIIVDKYREQIDRYLKEHEETSAQPQRKQAATVEFDPETFVREYVTYLDRHCKERIRETVGKVGGIGNSRSSLISLQLMKEMSYSETDVSQRESGTEENGPGQEGGIPMESMAKVQNHVNFILGKPGAGKTTVLLNLASVHCQEFINGTNPNIPVLIYLNSVANDNDEIGSVIVRALKKKSHGISDASDQTVLKGLEEKLKEGNFTFYIDGLNEVSVSNPRTFMEGIKEFISDYKSCTFFLTGRKYEFAEYRAIFSNVEDHGIYEVLEITKEQVLKFMKDIGVAADVLADFEKKIENTRISKLLGTPLNFHMIALALLKSDASSLNISNRGELLENFIGETLKDNTHNPDDPFHTLAPILLQKVAREMFSNSLQSVSMDTVRHLGKTIDISDDIFHKVMNRLTKLNIIRQEKFLNKKYVSFFVDTYQEYFLALDLVEDFSEGKLDIDVRNQKNLETLKLMVENIGGKSGNEIRLGRQLINEIAGQGMTDDPSRLNSNLELMAIIVSGLDPQNMRKEYPDARLTVENIVRNYLVHYRCSHPSPDLWKDYEHLQKLFKCASILSSRDILNELTSLYWMDVMGIMSQREIGKHSVGSVFQRYRLRDTIIRECSNVNDLYDKLHSLYMQLIWPYRSSAANLLKFIRELFSNISLADKKILYRHICGCLESGNCGNNEIIHMRYDANYLLLCIEDIDYLKKYDFDEESSKILWKQMHSLMRLSGSDRLSEIVFSDKFINKLYRRREQLLYMIRFHLFRNNIPEPLHNLLFGKGSKILEFLKSEDDPDGTISFKELLDILPISDIPEHVARQYYYESLYQFTLNRIEGDDEESFEALNYRRDNTTDDLRIFIRNVRTSFDGKYALFNINGKRHAFRILADSCERMMDDDAIIRKRVLTLERPLRGVIPSDKGEVQFAELKDDIYTPVRIDKRMMEDEISFDRKLYQPISTGRIKDNICQFNLIGQDGERIWINCAPLVNLRSELSGKSIIITSNDQDIRMEGTVNDVGRLKKDMVILTLRSTSIPETDRFGNLTVVYEDGRTLDLRYIHAFVQHRVVTVRLFNSPGVADICRRKDVRFRISTYDMMFESVETIRTSDTFCIEADLETGDAIAAPTSGDLHIKDEQKTIRLGFDYHYRIDRGNPFIQKGKISCIHISPEENRAEFYVKDGRINLLNPGYYLSIAGSPLHIRTEKRPFKPAWIARIRLVLERKYPSSGYIYLSDPSYGRFRYMTLSEEDSIIRIWPEDNYEGSLEGFMDMLKEDTQTLRVTGSGGALHSSVQDCEITEDEGYRYILVTDFPSSNESDVAAWKDVRNSIVNIMCLNHFWNLKESERGPENVLINIISYTKVSKDTIRIKKPLTSLADIFLKIDGGLTCRTSVVSCTNDYADIKVRTLNGLVPRLQDKGFVKFYRKNGSGYREEYVGYHTVYEVIDLDKPDKYHADICNIIEEELMEKLPDLMDYKIIKFFKAKSRSFMLVSNLVLFERIRKLLDKNGDHNMHFNVCKIHSTENDVQIKAISGLDGCDVNSSDTSSLLANHRYAKGDYILYEKNHKIHYLPEPQKHSCMGFFKGTVIKLVEEDREGQTRSFIKVHDLDLYPNHDFFCPEKHELGTIVSFFFNINLNKSDEDKQNLALDTSVIGMSTVREGTVLEISKDETEGSDKHYITIDSEDYETGIRIVEIYEGSPEWKTVSLWEKGYRCRYFMCNSKLYLKF